jgi:hypothetical protein
VKIHEHCSFSFRDLLFTEDTTDLNWPTSLNKASYATLETGTGLIVYSGLNFTGRSLTLTSSTNFCSDTYPGIGVTVTTRSRRFNFSYYLNIVIKLSFWHKVFYCAKTPTGQGLPFLGGRQHISLADLSAYMTLISSHLMGMHEESPFLKEPQIVDWCRRVQTELPNNPLLIADILIKREHVYNLSEATSIS